MISSKQKAESVHLKQGVGKPAREMISQATLRHKLVLIQVELLFKILCGHFDRFSAHLFSIRRSSRPKAGLRSQQHRQ